MSPSEIMSGASLANMDAATLYENVRGLENPTELLPDQSRIEKTAEDFEGVFLSLLIKELRGTSPEGGFFGEESSDSFGGMFDLFLGQHLAKSAPLGIPELIQNSYSEFHTDGGSKTISIKA